MLVIKNNTLLKQHIVENVQEIFITDIIQYTIIHYYTLKNIITLFEIYQVKFSCAKTSHKPFSKSRFFLSLLFRQHDHITFLGSFGRLQMVFDYF